MSEWGFCANENERCNFAGQYEVRYGKGSTWTTPQMFTGGVNCSNSVFGDPLKGTVKECQARAYSPPPPPPPVPMPMPMPAPAPQQHPQGFELSPTTLMLIAGGLLLFMFSQKK